MYRATCAGELGLAEAVPSCTLSVAEQLAAGMHPLFALLPAYYNERGRSADYLMPAEARSRLALRFQDYKVHCSHKSPLTTYTPQQARSRLALRVDSRGRLVDSDGGLAARSREAVGTFVDLAKEGRFKK